MVSEKKGFFDKISEGIFKGFLALFLGKEVGENPKEKRKRWLCFIGAILAVTIVTILLFKVYL
jgi:hypothetical protein